ncbi:hypothetical protein VTI74DRAFT_7409 [Chaetomium olivicolor]
MATGILQSPSSPEQEQLGAEEEDPVYQYPQDSWEYNYGTNHAFPNGVSAASAMWQRGLPLTTYDAPTMFGPELNGEVWPTYGMVPKNGVWDPSTNGSPSQGPHGTTWAASPSETLETLSTSTWSPSDQPLPSPMSEAQSYVLTQSPVVGNASTMRRASSTIPSPLTSRPDSPAASANRSLPTLAPKPKSKPKRNPKPSQPPSKRPVNADPTPTPRPRTLKRHRSDAPSIASSTNTATSASTTTTLGGVLPANVDPRVASEQIRREAWERCRAEAHEMSQRRMMLLDHERGALDREAQRLQLNLGRMREAAKGEVEAADRAGRWAEETK